MGDRRKSHAERLYQTSPNATRPSNFNNRHNMVEDNEEDPRSGLQHHLDKFKREASTYSTMSSDTPRIMGVKRANEDPGRPTADSASKRQKMALAPTRKPAGLPFMIEDSDDEDDGNDSRAVNRTARPHTPQYSPPSFVPPAKAQNEKAMQLKESAEIRRRRIAQRQARNKGQKTDSNPALVPPNPIPREKSTLFPRETKKPQPTYEKSARRPWPREDRRTPVSQSAPIDLTSPTPSPKALERPIHRPVIPPQSVGSSILKRPRPPERQPSKETPTPSKSNHEPNFVLKQESPVETEEDKQRLIQQANELQAAKLQQMIQDSAAASKKAEEDRQKQCNAKVEADRLRQQRLEQDQRKKAEADRARAEQERQKRIAEDKAKAEAQAQQQRLDEKIRRSREAREKHEAEEKSKAAERIAAREKAVLDDKERREKAERIAKKKANNAKNRAAEDQEDDGGLLVEELPDQATILGLEKAPAPQTAVPKSLKQTATDAGELMLDGDDVQPEMPSAALKPTGPVSLNSALGQKRAEAYVTKPPRQIPATPTRSAPATTGPAEAEAEAAGQVGDVTVEDAKLYMDRERGVDWDVIVPKFKDVWKTKSRPTLEKRYGLLKKAVKGADNALMARLAAGNEDAKREVNMIVQGKLHTQPHVPAGSTQEPPIAETLRGPKEIRPIDAKLVQWRDTEGKTWSEIATLFEASMGRPQAENTLSRRHRQVKKVLDLAKIEPDLLRRVGEKDASAISEINSTVYGQYPLPKKAQPDSKALTGTLPPRPFQSGTSQATLPDPITAVDVKLVRWKDRKSKWDDIVDSWEDETGSQLSQRVLLARYQNLKAAFENNAIHDNLLGQVEDGVPGAIEKVNRRIHGTVPNTQPVSQNGRVMPAEAARRDSHVEEQLGTAGADDVPEPRASVDPLREFRDNMSEEERNASLEHRPTTGGKSMNVNTAFYWFEHSRQAWQEMDEERQAELQEETPDDESEIDISEGSQDFYYYIYEVYRRELPKEQKEDGQTWEDMEWHLCSDTFETIEEANAVAAIEIERTYPGEPFYADPRDGPTMTKKMLPDGRMHFVMVNEEKGEVEVSINCQSRKPRDAIAPKSKENWISPSVYHVVEREWYQEKVMLTGPDGLQDGSFKTVYKDRERNVRGTASSDPEQANWRAAHYFVRKTAGGERNLNKLDVHMQKRIERYMRDLEEDPEEELFCQYFAFSNGDEIRVWVEEQQFTGPRNITR